MFPRMLHFHQVSILVVTFLAARGWFVEPSPFAGARQVSMVSPGGGWGVFVEQDNHDHSWHVRLLGRGQRFLQPPIHFPPVTTREGLESVLRRAADLHQLGILPSRPPLLNRFHEPGPNLPRSRSASPPPLRRDWTRQTSPHPG